MDTQALVYPREWMDGNVYSQQYSRPVILVVKAGCRLMHIPSHMPLCSYVAHTICVPCCGKRKKKYKSASPFPEKICHILRAGFEPATYG